MTRCLLRAKFGVALLTAVACLFLSLNHGAAKPAPYVPTNLGSGEPVPTAQDRLITQLICQDLAKYHLARPLLDDELSKRLFKRFFKTLDYSKLYFVKEDIEKLSEFETQLDDQLKRGEIDFAYKAYAKFMERAAERVKLVEKLLAEPMDFSKVEYMDTDYDKMDYASTEQELHERWRKRIKFDLLVQKLGSKAVSDPEKKKGDPDKSKSQPPPEETKPMTDAQAKEKILQRYQGMVKRFKQLDSNDLLELYLTDLTTCADPHSSYMSPSTLEDFEIAMRLQLEGIGALLRSENGTTIVAEIIPGGAAASDGRLKAKDKIIAVAQGDGKFVDVIDMKLRDVVKLIRGGKGTAVQLKVIPNNKIEPVVFNLTRQNIELKSQEARSEIIEHGKKPDGTPYRIGVIDLPSFYADMSATSRGGADLKSATDDMRKLLKNFADKKVDGVVLDLRLNGGGVLNEAISLTGLFIDRGPVVQVKGFDGSVKVKRKMDPDRGIVYGGPLMVLVSRYSASASEILAGALQDYDRALLVGDTATHGKGTVQQVINLGDQVQGQGEDTLKLGALKLTIQQFYRANGDSTQNKGVLSDIVLPSFSEVAATPEKDLDYALPFDQVKPVTHEDMKRISEDLKNDLRARSAERIGKSTEYTKLKKEIDTYKVQKAKKSLPLNEKELKAQFAKENAETAEEKLDGEPPDEVKSDSPIYKFAKSPANTEVLNIMQDWLNRGK
ncbi:MAG TPA: carboxy terminal-processing peptidase [Gemmataceae bacterium]|nr:carboxy terminal-processing peptidase [Gemmataceae bacterium]